MTDSSKSIETEIAALAAAVKAPESLHRRVQAMVDAAGEHRERRIGLPGLRLAGAGALGAAATAAAAAAVVALSGGGSPGLTVEKAAALTLRPATMAAPRESRTHREQLDAAVEGVAFPYWRDRFGWRSAGARLDRIAGRSVTTVFYADAAGRWIGYAIASGSAPRLRTGTIRWSARRVPYSVSSQQGATVVAWPRSGHLCVVAGRGVDAATLLRLAGWHRAANASA
jgi:hypothetical protein